MDTGLADDVEQRLQMMDTEIQRLERPFRTAANFVCKPGEAYQEYSGGCYFVDSAIFQAGVVRVTAHIDALGADADAKRAALTAVDASVVMIRAAGLDNGILRSAQAEAERLRAKFMQAQDVHVRSKLTLQTQLRYTEVVNEAHTVARLNELRERRMALLLTVRGEQAALRRE